jgi:hypothetical protein
VILLIILARNAASAERFENQKQDLWQNIYIRKLSSLIITDAGIAGGEGRDSQKQFAESL